MSIEISSPLPSLRLDLDLVEVMPGIVALYDGMGYTDTSIRLPLEIVDLLLEGGTGRTIAEIISNGDRNGRPIESERFIEVVNLLDSEGFLMSPGFYRRRDAIHREYNRLPVRPPAHAGFSYPDDPAELRTTLDRYLQEGGARDSGRTADAIFVPHIDPRVGGETYGPAYNAIRDSDADTFVILGVPHTMQYDRLMFSSMDFDTPIGRLETDREFIDEFRSGLSGDLTTDEVAHMNEHSIEFQTLFLQHLFGDRKIKIVPVLLGSLTEYVESGRGGIELDLIWTEIYRNFTRTAEKLGRKVCWIASVDFCHVGRKFGDQYDAADRLDDVRQHDYALVEEVVKGDAVGFISRLIGNQNSFRVCGISPMYALLRMMAPVRGELLAYDQWDERERCSGVSFASIALYGQTPSVGTTA